LAHGFHERYNAGIEHRRRPETDIASGSGKETKTERFETGRLNSWGNWPLASSLRDPPANVETNVGTGNGGGNGKGLVRALATIGPENEGSDQTRKAQANGVLRCSLVPQPEHRASGWLVPRATPVRLLDNPHGRGA
jgi:hypothetical protein